MVSWPHQPTTWGEKRWKSLLLPLFLPCFSPWLLSLCPRCHSSESDREASIGNEPLWHDALIATNWRFQPSVQKWSTWIWFQAVVVACLTTLLTEPTSDHPRGSQAPLFATCRLTTPLLSPYPFLLFYRLAVCSDQSIFPVTSGHKKAPTRRWRLVA